MKPSLLSLILIWVCISIAFSQQQTITVTTGTGFKEATIYKDNRSGYSYYSDENYQDYPRIIANAWTHSGSTTFRRSFIYFDLSQIPEGSTIHSAILYLYSDPNVTSSGAWNGNSNLSGSNALFLEKVIGEWDEGTLTWNNQPATTTNQRVWIPSSVSTTENIQVSLNTLVQSWVSNPLTNNGLRFKLENEVYYRSRNYASTNHPNSNLHPKLVITFTPPATNESICSTPDISEEEYTSLPWYGDGEYLDNFYDSLYQAQEGQLPQSRLLNDDIESVWLRAPIKYLPQV